MARGSRKTPPPHTRSPIVTQSHSDNNVTSETTTTSNENPQIPVEPVTPNPQGADVQEIVRQSLLRTHSALAHIRQPGRPLNQPLDFSDIREQLEGTGLLLNPLGDDTINPTDTPTLGAGDLVFHLPHLIHLHPLQEESHLTKAVHHLNHLSLRHHLHPWKTKTIPPDHGSIKMLWLYLDPNTLYQNTQRNGYLSSIQILRKSSEDHIKKFMLAIRLRSVEHEDVVCRLFPYTFEGNASTWYFSQQPHTIVSWDRFETCS
jgi:hypothetical protein